MLSTKLLLPLYSWGLGAALIGLFALVCVGLVLVVMNIMKNDTPKEVNAQNVDSVVEEE